MTLGTWLYRGTNASFAQGLGSSPRYTLQEGGGRRKAGRCFEDGVYTNAHFVFIHLQASRFQSLPSDIPALLKMAMVLYQYSHCKSKCLYSHQKLYGWRDSYSSSFSRLLLPRGGIIGRRGVSGQALGNGVQLGVRMMHSGFFCSVCFGS